MPILEVSNLEWCPYQKGIREVFLVLYSYWKIAGFDHMEIKFPSLKNMPISIYVGPSKGNGEKPMTNISNIFLQMCLVSPPEVDVCSEERNTVFSSPFFLPPNPETQTIKLKVRKFTLVK